MIYLDYSATTPLDEDVLDVITKNLRDSYANPSSIHQLGRNSRFLIDEAREIISDMINAKPLEIIFTSGGTEADNLAVLGAIRGNKNRGKHVISAASEHHAVSNTLRKLDEEGEIELTLLDLDEEGFISADKVKAALRDDTVLCSIMYVNNELGAINDVNSICEICHENETLFHTDAVQAFGKFKIDVNELGIDLLSASSHKLYGPKGIGFTYIRKGTIVDKQVVGGHQEFDMRAGTENAPLISGFGKAASVASERQDADYQKAYDLNKYTREKLNKHFDEYEINTPTHDFSPYILNVSFPGCSGESIVMQMDQRGYCISSGSACTSGSVQPSDVIASMGKPFDVSTSAIRISFGRHTSKEDIDGFIDNLKEVIDHLRSLNNK